jgi:GT2 family glycosyltransferase
VDLSVVIPTLDGASRLRETLAGIGRAAASSGGLEVIVVDDGSPTAVEDMLGSVPGEVPTRFVRLPENRGRGPACNAGVQAARGRVILILDDDMTVGQDTLVGHLRVHEEGASRVAVLGRIDTKPDLLDHPYGKCFAREESERHGRLRRRADDVAFQDCLTGHFSIRRDLLLEVGGYNNDFSRYGFEDIELAWRLKRQGVRLRYVDRLTTLHRSAHANFTTACRRHREAGAMAVLFARAASDPDVDAFLRVAGMRPGEEHGRFRRTLARAHQLTRSIPRPLRTPLLLGARIGVLVGRPLLPDRWLCASYIVVRDMHFAAGMADVLELENGVPESGEGHSPHR